MWNLARQVPSMDINKDNNTLSSCNARVRAERERERYVSFPLIYITQHRNK